MSYTSLFSLALVLRKTKLLVKSELIDMTQAWESPTGIKPLDFPNTGQMLYPLSYENSWRARSIN